MFKYALSLLLILFSFKNAIAFPDYAVLIDNFNRANETPMLGNWSSPIFSGGGQAALVSNAVRNTSYSTAWYNVATFGPNVEVYGIFRAAATSSDEVVIYFNLTNPGALVSAYRVSHRASPQDVLVIRTNSNVDTTLLTITSQTFAAGDSLGAEINGAVINVWKKPAAGGWSQIGTITDSSPLNQTGFFGVMGNGNGADLNDFYGATIGSPGGDGVIIYYPRRRGQ